MFWWKESKNLRISVLTRHSDKSIFSNMMSSRNEADINQTSTWLYGILLLEANIIVFYIPGKTLFIHQGILRV